MPIAGEEAVCSTEGGKQDQFERNFTAGTTSIPTSCIQFAEENLVELDGWSTSILNFLSMFKQWANVADPRS